MFAVDDIDETLERLRKRGAQLVGEVVRYEDACRLCYIRGPEGLLTWAGTNLAWCGAIRGCSRSSARARRSVRTGLERLLGMGMEEGMKAAMAQIDGVLAT